MPIKFTGLATLKAFKDELDLRYAAKDDVKEYKLVKLSSATDGAFASYQLQVDGTAVAGSATIDVPKDYLIRKAELKTVVDGDTFIGDEFAVNDKYIALTINAKDATLGTDDTVLRINVKDLFNEYTSGDGIEITNGVVSLKVASGSPLSIDGATGELKIATASTTTAGILSPEDYTKFFNASEATITIGAAQGTGNVVTAINNVGGAIVPTLGITALQEDDLEEIDAATVQSLWSNGGGNGGDQQDP